MLQLSVFTSYLEKKNEVDKLFDSFEPELLKRILYILAWENEHIGTHHDINCPTCEYEFSLELLKTGVNVAIDIFWGSEGCDKEFHFIPYTKILSDDWMPNAIQEYNDKLEEARQRKKQEQEEKDFKEYQRLKAKYEY